MSEYQPVQATSWTDGKRSATELTRVVADGLGFQFGPWHEVYDADLVWVARSIDIVSEAALALKWIRSSDTRGSVDWDASPDGPNGLKVSDRAATVALLRAKLVELGYPAKRPKE